MAGTDQLELVRAACGQLVGAADGALEWKWDGRLGTATAAFGADLHAAVRATLDACFERCWSSTEIGAASARVTAVAAKLGGLRGGQLLWVASPDAPVMLFCAWWPWGGGARVSIRVGYDADGADDTASARPDLESWFDL